MAVPNRGLSLPSHARSISSGSTASSNVGGIQRVVKGISCFRLKTAMFLERQCFHTIIIVLTLTDASCVLADLIYIFLVPDCRLEPEPPLWLEILGRISLGITSVFVLEIIISLWAFGFKWYNPFSHHPFAWLHLFDAFIITTAFALEVGLKGREGEVAGLLILFRLWRIIRLVGGIAVGAAEIEEDNIDELREAREEIKQLQGELKIARQENNELYQRMKTLAPSHV